MGGIGQDVIEEEFKEYFEQFGTVLDATLMMDKETGRPRGFGFVTFDDDSAVETCMSHGPLAIKGKMVNLPRDSTDSRLKLSAHNQKVEKGNNNPNVVSLTEAGTLEAVAAEATLAVRIISTDKVV